MWILSDSSKSIKAQVSVAPSTALDYIVTYNDAAWVNAVKGNDSASGTISNTLSTVLPAPGERIKRDLRSLTVNNTDSNTQVLSIYFSDNGTDRLFYRCELLPGERVEFEWDKGWQTYTSNGLKKSQDVFTPIHYTSNPGTTLTDIYSVAASKVARVKIIVCNRSSSNKTFRVAISKNAASISDSHYISYDGVLSSNETIEFYSEFMLNSSDIVRVYGSTSDVSFTVNGVEYE